MGIPIRKKTEYLEYTLSPVRKQLFHDAETNIMNSLKKIKGKIRLQNPEVAKIV